MAEASEWAYIYVIVVGIGLSIMLFAERRHRLNKDKYENEKLILNKCDKSDKNMTFTKSNLLQANAAVIAGLFVFLTVQGNSIANLPALIDTNVDMEEIKKYDQIRKDESRDQIVRDEAEKRYAETTLDLEKKYIRLSAAYDYQTVQYVTNPVVMFTASLLPFSFSSIFIIVSKNEESWAFKISKGLTICGFFLMFAGALFFIGFPIVPS